MTYEEYEKALLKEPFDEILDVERILDTYYHSGIPFAFQGDVASHGSFIRMIANEVNSTYEINCHPLDIKICGSAHLGFSASPGPKLGTSFDGNKSDIDVAVIHPELFDRWWLELVDPRAKHGSPPPSIVENLFNGLIDPREVRQFTNIGAKWWSLFGRITHGQFKKIRGRIYRSGWFMQNYHRLSITRARDKLLRDREKLNPFPNTIDT